MWLAYQIIGAVLNIVAGDGTNIVGTLVILGLHAWFARACYSLGAQVADGTISQQNAVGNPQGMPMPTTTVPVTIVSTGPQPVQAQATV